MGGRRHHRLRSAVVATATAAALVGAVVLTPDDAARAAGGLCRGDDPQTAALSRALASAAADHRLARVSLTDPALGLHCAVRADVRSETASIVKILIVAALFDARARAGHAMSASDLALARQAIRVSDNDATSALYRRLGRGPAFRAWALRAGLPGITPGVGTSWGKTMVSPATMDRFLGALQSPGGAVRPAAATFIRGNMAQVVSWQRWGVTAGAGAGPVALKNGWKPTPPTNAWAVNSVGFVGSEHGTYTLAVMSFGAGTMAGGIAQVEGVAAVVNRELRAWRFLRATATRVSTGAPNASVGGTTNARATVRLSRAADGRQVRVVAGADGRWAAAVPAPMGVGTWTATQGAARPVTVMAEGAARIAGVTPVVGGFDVRLPELTPRAAPVWRVERVSGAKRVAVAVRSTRSGQRWAFRRLAAGTYRVTVAMPGGRTTAWRTVTVAPLPTPKPTPTPTPKPTPTPTHSASPTPTPTPTGTPRP